MHGYFVFVLEDSWIDKVMCVNTSIPFSITSYDLLKFHSNLMIYFENQI